MAAIDDGDNVLVSAPTGSGKTVVAEHAVAAALAQGRRCFYTTPIKALSNQKFNDLREQVGADQVGLLTGDHSIIPEAPVVVMTTEVLRNMIYARSGGLDDLGWVVLDEVHFLQDAYRGPVWEEVLISAPPTVRFVCLSATISNADELGEWITSLRGTTQVVVEHTRPVQLDALMLVGDRHAEDDHLVPLVVDGRPNPEGRRFDAEQRVRHQRGKPPPRQRSRFRTPRRWQVAERLGEERLLPSLYFIFSRAGCDDAARRYLESGRRLTDPEQRSRIREIAEARTSTIAESDLEALGYGEWLQTLQHGAAAHHAGMIPAFREAVEQCFIEGLLSLVFATETLALGINMPARSVVIERLTKFNGDTHEFLSPAQFTQLTGRAGRRGLDEHGTAVVLWSPFVTFAQVATLAASRDFPLRSSFRPTYNMTANLVRRYDRADAHRVLASSFAQFHNERELVELRQRTERLGGELDAATDAGERRHLQRSLRRARKETRRRESGLDRQFDRVVDVLEATGHVQDWSLTAPGERLRRIYHESDLLISMAIDDHLFDDLADADLASLVSCFTYEHRSASTPPPPNLPTAELARRFTRLGRIAGRLNDLEDRKDLSPTRPPEAGFAVTARAWAGGVPLAALLDEDLTGGDFVRNVRQLADLLRQIGEVVPNQATATAARRVTEALERGVIAASSELA